MYGTRVRRAFRERAVALALGLALVAAASWSAGPVNAAEAPYRIAALPTSDPTSARAGIVTDGAHVYWFDRAGALYGRELATGRETRLADGPADRSQLAFANGVLVWTERDRTGASIRALSLASREAFTLASGPGDRNSPAASGSTVIWRDRRAGNWDIYRYDLNRRQASPLVVDGVNQGAVAITGETVLWEDHRTGVWNLRGYDLANQVEFTLAAGPDDYLNPVAAAGLVAYVRRAVTGGIGTLIVRDLATGDEQIVASDRPITRVAVSSGTVIWEDWRDGSPNIYGFDRTTGQEFVVTRSEQARDPAVAANVVVWLSRGQFATRVSAVRLERPLPTDPRDPPTVPDASIRYFEATKHSIAEPFKTFWLRHDGLALFGFPITEPFDERVDGGAPRRVQYFERARLEVDPADPTTVAVGRLGAEAVRDRSFPTVAPLANTADRVFVPQTGRSIGGAFKAYWEAHGGVAIFGYPLSEETREGGMTVQYFERARFEFHPDASAAKQVTLAQLGREALVARGWLPGGKSRPLNR